MDEETPCFLLAEGFCLSWPRCHEEATDHGKLLRKPVGTDGAWLISSCIRWMVIRRVI